MKKTLILLTFGLFCMTSGCTERKDIKTIKTEQHTNIPGTRLFLIKPDGFKVSEMASGILKGDSGSILVSDLKNVDYNSCVINISENEFKKNGTKVFDYEEIHVNGYNGRFAYIQGYMKNRPTAKSYYLVFGDSTFCTAIIGTFKEGDEITQEQIKTALQTVYYDKTTKIDNSFRMNGFELNDSKSTIKFCSYIGGTRVYTKNGLNDEKAYPMLTVNKVPKYNYTVKTLEELTLKNLNNIGYSNISTKSELSTKTNGFDSYESVNYGSFKGDVRLVYIRTVLLDNYFVVALGFGDKDYEKSLAEIRKLSNTINKK